MKICKDCLQEKRKDEFYGVQGECKDCTKSRVSKYAKTPRGKEVDRKRNQKPERRAWCIEANKRNRIKWRKRKRVQNKFWREFKKGTIEKLPCQKCGTTSRVEAHHCDYDKPFDILWLCSLHHKEWHRNNEAKNSF